MARGEREYLTNLQRFFNEPDFKTMVERLKYELFEEQDERERIFAKLELVDLVCNALRAAADTVTFEKQNEEK